MKRFPLLLVGLLFAAVLPLLAADTPPSSVAPTTEIKVATGIDNREPTGASDNFEVPADTKIWVWARVRDVPAGSMVAILFRKGETERFRKELSVPQVPHRTNAFRTFRKGDDGEWTAAIISSDGKELASAKFTATIGK